MIATKFGFKHGENGPGPGTGLDSRPQQVRQVAEESLKRLRVEAIDLFYQHRPDPDVPVEDVAGAVKDLIQEGKLHRLDKNIGAVEIQLTADDLSQIKEVMADINVVGDRY